MRVDRTERRDRERSRSVSPVRVGRTERRERSRERSRLRSTEEGRQRDRLPAPSLMKAAAILAVDPKQPLAAFNGDEQLILENYFRKHDPTKTAKQIAALRKKTKDFRSLCTRLAQVHGDPDPMAMWKQPMHGHKPSRHDPSRSATVHNTVPYSKPGRSDTLREAAQAAGKNISKAVAMELRVEEAKKQIRRASYNPSARSRMTIDRRSIDEELRENGFHGGIHSATPEQIKEAKLRLTLRASAVGDDASIWTEENMRKLNTKYKRPLDEPLDFDLFLESLRRFGKVTRKMMQEDEVRIVFERIDTDGDERVTPEECQEFIDSPPAPHLQDWLKSAGGGSLQKVQLMSTSNSQLGRVPLGDEGWVYVADQQLAQGPPVRVVELDDRQQDKLWKDCNFNSSSKVSLAELTHGITKFPPDGWIGFDSKPAIALAYKQADRDWSGYIVRDEFDELLKYLVFYTVLWKRFAEHDVAEEGRLSRPEFSELCLDLDLDMRGSDAVMHFEEIDRDRSGSIEFAEFCQFVSDCAVIDRWSWQQLIEWVQSTQSDPTTPLHDCVVCSCDSRELDELWALWDHKRSNALALGQVWEAYCRDPPLDWYGIDSQQAFNLAFEAAVGKTNGGLMKRDRLALFLKSLVYMHVLWDVLERVDPSFAVWMTETQLKEITFDEIVEWFEDHRTSRPEKRQPRRRVQIRLSNRSAVLDDQRRLEHSQSGRTIPVRRVQSPRRTVTQRAARYSFVLQKTRAYGLGIICSSECEVTGFRGRSAEEAGVPLGTTLVAVNGQELNGDLSLLQDIVQTIRTGDEVDLVLEKSADYSTRSIEAADRVSPASSRPRSVSPRGRATVRSRSSPRTGRSSETGGRAGLRTVKIEDELNARLDMPYERWGETWSNGALHTRDIDGEELFCDLVEELRADGVVSDPGAHRAYGRSSRFRDCEDEVELGFEDSYFPAADSSIYSGRRHQISGWSGPAAGQSIEWKRPYEIGAVTYSRGDEMAPEDVEPENFDNSYFLAALSMLATQCRNTTMSRSGAESGALLRDLIIDSGEEQGIFGIKFFVNGTWRTVVIDDRIPCTETSRGVWTPCFAREQRDGGRAVLWPFLFLKAWSKLCGSYEATAGGHTYDALNYLTGGLCDSISLTPDPTAGRSARSPSSPRSPGRGRTGNADPWEELKDATTDTGDEDFPVFVVATLRPPMSRRSASAVAEIEELGLELGQAYEVLCVAEVSSDLELTTPTVRSRRGQRLVCLWSPWSTVDYTGDYSVRSEAYRRVRTELQRYSDKANEPLLGGGFAVQNPENSMFWMPFEDFTRLFGEVGVCDPWTAGCINPTAPRRIRTVDGTVIEQHTSALEVDVQAIHGKWVAGVSAGGTVDDETFEHNPTYELQCDGEYVAVSLFQRDPRGLGGTHGSSGECAPMALYLVTERSDSRGEAVPEEEELIKLTAPHHRQASRTVTLTPGCRRWLVVAADAPGVAGEFWITATAQNCRLIESTPARPDRAAADAMRSNRSTRR